MLRLKAECFFWYRLTWVVPEQKPLNGCSSVVAIYFEWLDLETSIFQFGDIFRVSRSWVQGQVTAAKKVACHSNYWPEIAGT